MGLCKCECGGIAKSGNRFINGHHRRIPLETRYCLCECGDTFICKINSKRRYISGHNSRGKNNVAHREDVKKKHSIFKKQWWKENRDKNIELIRKAQNTPECKEKMSKSAIEVGKRPEVKKFRSDKMKKQMARLKNTDIYTSKEYKEKRRVAILKTWKDPIIREKRIKNCLKKVQKTPNVPETKLLELLNLWFAKEWEYCGDGSVIIGFKNPDFINRNGKKLLVEMFGDYWHRGEDENVRINHFKKYGFNTLIVWERELKDLDKLKKRMESFMEIQNV